MVIVAPNHQHTRLFEWFFCLKVHQHQAIQKGSWQVSSKRFLLQEEELGSSEAQKFTQNQISFSFTTESIFETAFLWFVTFEQRQNVEDTRAVMGGR